MGRVTARSIQAGIRQSKGNYPQQSLVWFGHRFEYRSVSSLSCNDQEHMNLVAEALREGISLGLLDSHQVSRSLTRVEDLRSAYLERLELPDPDRVAAYFAR